MNDNIELLTLISDLVNSKDTSRRAVGAEVKRLTAAMQAQIEKLETEQTRLNKIIHAVEVASRRRLKNGETVYNIISAVQDALESA